MYKLSNAYFAVRTMDLSNSSSSSYGGPQIPATWNTSQHSSEWRTHTSPTGDVFASKKINEINATDGLFVIFGDKEYLDGLASASNQIAPAKEVWRRRAEVQMQTVLRYIPDWICTGIQRNPDDSLTPFTSGSKTLLHQIGNVLPNIQATPLPWNLDLHGNITAQASASIRITDLHQPTLLSTLAGLSMDQITRDEPDRG